MRFIHALVVIAVAALGLAAPALAVEPSEILPDAALEHRARQISAELRCLVCQNQSIDDSNAPLAKDLRVLVRERLSVGESDKAVMDYVVARYGDFVLLKPPVNRQTILLWLAPLACLVALAYALIQASRRSSAAGATQASAPLSADEEAKLRRLLKKHNSPS